jgi:hypothetical protein
MPPSEGSGRNLTDIEDPASANVVYDDDTFAEHLNRVILHPQNAVLVSCDLRKSNASDAPTTQSKRQTSHGPASSSVAKRAPGTLRRIGD